MKTEANITDIIYFYNGVFYIDRELLHLPYDEATKEKIDINNLKGLRYGKTEIEIDTRNLKPLELQLDDIIQNDSKGIICEIPKQEIEIE